MLNKAKIGLHNLGLKFISVDEKLVRMFLETVPKDVREIVLLPVTKIAMQEFIRRMGNSHAQHGLVHNGIINGVHVSTIRCQMGAPYAAIVIECLKRSGVKKVVRCDYAGSISDKIGMGDLIIPEYAIGGEGTTPHYSSSSDPSNIPATFAGSPGIVKALWNSAQRIGYPCHKAKIMSTDALFRETPENVSLWQVAGADTVDMETSAIYCLGTLFNIQAGAILAISDKPNTEFDLFHTNKIHDSLEIALLTAIDVVVGSLPEIKTL